MKRMVVRILLAGAALLSVVVASPAVARAQTTSSTLVASSVAGRHMALFAPHTNVDGLYAKPKPKPKPKPLGHGDLVWNGGPVEHHPVVYAILWGSSWEQSATTLNQPAQLVKKYLTDVGGSSFEAVLTQYHDNTGPVTNTTTLGGLLVDTSPLPTGDSSCGGPTIEDSAIQQEIVNVAQAQSWPIPSADATYIMYTPTHYFVNDGAGDCSMSVFCAYHAWSTTTPGFAYATVAYPNDPGCDVPHSPNHNMAGDSLVSTTSHEQFESITDPEAGNGWLDSAVPVPYEIADKCIWDYAATYTTLRNGGHFAVQGEYSNASHACVLSYAPPPPPHKTHTSKRR